MAKNDTGSPGPNPEFVRKDPMAELFGPGSSVKLLGDPDDEIPDEVRGAIEEHGLSTKQFQCTLKEIPTGSEFDGPTSSTNTKYIRSWTRSIPSISYIAREHGPGEYFLILTWRGRDLSTDGESKSMRQEIPISISDKAAEEHKQHKLGQKIRAASALGTRVHETMIEKKLEGEMMKALTGGQEERSEQNPAEVARQYITQTLETVKMLGIPMGAQPVAKEIEWDKLLPAVVPLVLGFLQHQAAADRARSEDFNKMLMLMMSNSQNSSTQLIDIMKSTTGANAGANSIKEMRDMIFGAIDIKEALQGAPKETLSDKIFRMVETVAPQILAIANTAAQTANAKANPMVGMTKQYIESNPDFQALLHDPVEKQAFIEKMDSFFGWRQTDIILQVAAWDRPATCARRSDQEYPASQQVADNGEGMGVE